MEHIVLEIGLALLVMSFAGFIASKLRLSTAPLLIFAGLAVGPHLPYWGVLDFRFINSAPIISLMGRLGVLFLLFYLGLEFSIGRLLKARRSIAVSGIIYMAINLTLGIIFPWVLGWPYREILVAAGITTISSSAIVAKMIVDLKRAANPDTEIILGLMMFQDVFVAVYLSVVSGLVLTGETSFHHAMLAAGIALGFIATLILLGRKFVSRLNFLLDIASDELFLLTLFALLTIVSGFSETLNVAEAIGALIFGLVLSETEHVQRIEHLIVPFRDFFGAFFFFSFGLSIDPLALKGAVWPALIAVLLTVVGNFVAGIFAGRIAGMSPRGAVNIGLTITSRGEFSIILANLAKQGGLLAALQPFAALYVLVLAVLGPILTKESKRVYKLFSPLIKWRVNDKYPVG
ncbi:cation:proton antiporter [Candidatus Formimonas warabiya]|nr:cation:proton antiporter [Candidatus Formimonas warabiya]